MLDSYPIIAFIATHNPDLAKRFYRDILGLRLVTEDKTALVFDAHGTVITHFHRARQSVLITGLSRQRDCVQ